MSEDYALESQSTASVSKALAAAQGDIKAPKKGKTAKVKMKSGGEYSYSYADLADVIECLREPFAKHGLSQSQAMRAPNGHVEIVTTIRHESGEWVRSYYPLPNYPTPQEMGSAISYGRRYSLTALAGIMAEDDDDGERAQHAEPVKREAKAPPAPVEAVKPPADPLTQEDMEKVGTLAKRAGLAKHADLKPVLKKLAGVETLKALDRAFLADLLATLTKMGDEGIVKDVEEMFGAPAGA